MQIETSYIPRHQELIAADRAATGHHFRDIKRFNYWANFVIYFVLTAGLAGFAPQAFATLQPVLGSPRSVSVIVVLTVAVMLLAGLGSQGLRGQWTVGWPKR